MCNICAAHRTQGPKHDCCVYVVPTRCFKTWNIWLFIRSTGIKLKKLFIARSDYESIIFGDYISVITKLKSPKHLKVRKINTHYTVKCFTFLLCSV